MTNTNSTPLIFNMVLDPVSGKKVVCMPIDDLVEMTQEAFYKGFWTDDDKLFSKSWTEFKEENETFKQLSQLNKQIP